MNTDSKKSQTAVHDAEPQKPGPWLLFFQFLLAVVVAFYLLALAIASIGLVAINFPQSDGGILVFPYDNVFYPFNFVISTDIGLILIAFLSGVAGSFLHTAQSLATYVGNRTFVYSWTMWYILRPWIGGALGFALYFTFRAGLISGVDSVNPYGLVTIAVLGGWFSKTTADKLLEVFETLFNTDQDKTREDKLSTRGGTSPQEAEAITVDQGDPSQGEA